MTTKPTPAARRRLRAALLRTAWATPCRHGCQRWEERGRWVLIGRWNCPAHGIDMKGEPR